MKTKTFSSMTVSGLDKKINDFLQAETVEPIKVIDIKFSNSNSAYAALIMYESTSLE